VAFLISRFTVTARSVINKAPYQFYYFFVPVLRCLNWGLLLLLVLFGKGEGSQSNVLLLAPAAGVLSFSGMPNGWSAGFSVAGSPMGCNAAGSVDGLEAGDLTMIVCCHEEAQAE
jgi:hypothetical protein